MNVMLNIESHVFVDSMDQTLSVIGIDQDSVIRVLREFCDYLYNRLVLTDTTPQWILQECCSGALEFTHYVPAARNTPMYLREVIAFEKAISHMTTAGMRTLADNGCRLDNIVYVNTKSDMLCLMLLGSEYE